MTTTPKNTKANLILDRYAGFFPDARDLSDQETRTRWDRTAVRTREARRGFAQIYLLIGVAEILVGAIFQLPFVLGLGAGFLVVVIWLLFGEPVIQRKRLSPEVVGRNRAIFDHYHQTLASQAAARLILTRLVSLYGVPIYEVPFHDAIDNIEEMIKRDILV